MSCRVSNPKSSRLEIGEQIPRIFARDADARRIVGWRLESAEYIPRVLGLGALAPVAKCLLGKRDGDARRSAGPSGVQPVRIVGSRLENSRMLCVFPAALLPGPPLCIELGALPITPFYNT